MAVLTGSFLLDILLTIFSVFLFFYLRFHLYGKYYWKRKNIPYLEPKFLIGNTWKSTIIQPAVEVMQELYNANKDKSLLGHWQFSRPVLFVNDVGYVKNILVKDFQHFHDRGLKNNIEADPLSGHLFNMSGSQWRNLRAKLTPTFTSGKMKMMFPTMVECGEELQKFLEKPAAEEEIVEIKDILARFTTDIISSCAFGIQTNSLQNPDSEFRVHGRKIFRRGLGFLLFRIVTNANLPLLAKILRVRRLPQEVTDFFMNAVKETIEVRERNNIKRKDFMELLIQLKNKGSVDSVDNPSNENKGSAGDKFTFQQLAAQAFVFFVAGFETSSTAMQFALYELAKNPELQRTLQKEIDRVLAKHDNQVTYDAVQEMDYLDRVINESLRKYPPVPVLLRECTKDYTFPNGTAIDKGTFLMIPVHAIQNDPKHYPNPERFDPDRFSPEEKAKRDHFLHLPFGEGPRICIGNRFGLLQSKIGLIHILSRYDINVCDKTPIPMKLAVNSFIPSPATGMFLRMSMRKQKELLT